MVAAACSVLLTMKASEGSSSLEQQIAELDRSLGSPDLYAPGADPKRPKALTAERDAAQSRLDEVFARWEELEDLRG